jgi:hypothetical protein
MSENQPIWMDWARTLEHWGINTGVASLLEVTGSLCVLLAQLLYLGQPLISGMIPSRSVDAFARMLENPAERQEFVTILRERSAHEPAA